MKSVDDFANAAWLVVTAVAIGYFAAHIVHHLIGGSP